MMSSISSRQIIVCILSGTLIVLGFLNNCFASDVPANFVFGDSLVDAGNNNYIVTLSKANLVPNGIDFGAPTGRYTNGRTIADILGQALGLGLIPPYLAPSTKGSVILQGVNYASGGGGILNETGKNFGGRINMDAQLDNFANTRQDIISSSGASAALKLLQTSLFSVTIGANDFINNYLMAKPAEQNLESPESFVTSMIKKFRLQLTRLYNLGARKILVSNVGPLGCIPYERDMNASAGSNCITLPNQLAQIFNTQLKTLLDDLRASLHDSKFVYADAYRILEHITQNYKSYGFENTDSACCYVAGRHGGLVPCGPPSKVCSDRSKYVFWDPYHPSDATNSVIAKLVLDGPSDYISPINLRQLAEEA